MFLATRAALAYEMALIDEVYTPVRFFSLRFININILLNAEIEMSHYCAYAVAFFSGLWITSQVSIELGITKS